MSHRVGLPAAVPVLIFALALAPACGTSGPATLSTFQRILDDPAAADSPNQARAHLTLGDGGAPNVRFVEFDDGDQHLALVVKAPATFSFRTIVPRRGELRFSLAVRPPRAPVRIELRAANEEGTIYEETWQRSLGWSERRVDLSHLEGRRVELQFSVKGAQGSVSFAHPEIVGQIEEIRRPNVLVYVVDCLRADHVGAYGYDRPTTPALDALATDSVVFESSYSCAAWTKPSTGCLFTSLNPTFHGAQAVGDVLSSEHPTLAERFRDHGYATAAWIANPFLYERGFGLTRGFDHVVALRKPSPKMSINAFKADAADITRGVLPWLEQNRDRRFFLYLHSIDAHYEYRARPPFDELFVRTDGEEPARAIDLYDSELAYNDHEIGKLVKALKELELYDDTIIVVTSDHGEEFGEHGYERHGKSLHEAAVRIPWVMKLQRENRRATRIDALASNLDVAPTLLDYAGIPSPDSFEGVSWRRFIEADEEPPSRRLFFEQVASEDVLYAVRDGRLKYISRLLPQPEDLFYDVARDPDELDNLLPTRESPVELTAALLDYMRLGQRGYHVSVHHPDPDTWIEVEAWTDSAFLRVQRYAQELGDDFRVSEDGKRVTYVFQAKRRRRHLVLRTEPMGARVYFRMRVDGRDWPRDELILGENDRVDAMPFEVIPDAVQVPFDRISVLLDAPETHAAIWYQLAPLEKTTIPLDPELKRRLRALGYLQ